MDPERRGVHFTSSKHLSTIKAKLEKSSHLTTELVVSLIVNHEECMLRALFDTSTNISIILDGYTSDLFIKTDDSNTTTWSTSGGKFTTYKTG
jgi:hypothetical protein